MWRTFSFTTDETVFNSNTTCENSTESHVKVKNEKLSLYTQKSVNIKEYNQISNK